MNSRVSETASAASANKAASGRLFFLDLGGGRVRSANPEGSDLKTMVSEGRKLPDGIVVDVTAGHLYWANMGNPSANDGSNVRFNLSGGNITTIVPVGARFTPKQLQLDKKNGKLYWSDREGMRVMGSNLDGSAIETPEGPQQSLVQFRTEREDLPRRPGGSRQSVDQRPRRRARPVLARTAPR
jgi:hypothetical protein